MTSCWTWKSEATRGFCLKSFLLALLWLVFCGYILVDLRCLRCFFCFKHFFVDYFYMFLGFWQLQGKLMVGFKCDFKEIDFSEEEDILLVAEELPLHPNAMICRALSRDFSSLWLCFGWFFMASKWFYDVFVVFCGFSGDCFWLFWPHTYIKGLSLGRFKENYKTLEFRYKDAKNLKKYMESVSFFLKAS